MSSRSKNFRRRADDDDNEENDVHVSGVTSKATPNITTKSSSKATSSDKPKKSHQKLLSFAEDEDNETPFSRPPKSSSSSRFSKHTSSHKIMPIKDRVISSPGSVPSNVQPQAGQYTKEALLELQKNTKTLGSSRPRAPATEPKPVSTSEPVVVLKGLVKPVLGTSEHDGSTEHTPRMVEETDSLKRDKDDAERKLGLMAIGKGESMEGKDSGIPDQDTINAIRAKRERLRQSRAAAPDYISLDGGSNHGAAEGLSDEEPEFQTRIAMFGEANGAKKGVFEEVDERPMHAGQLNVDDDDDEEERKWEEEQFRKGLGKRMDEGSCGVSRSATSAHSGQPQSYMHTASVPYPSATTISTGPPSIGGVIGGVPGVEPMSISEQAEVAKQALQDTVRRLKGTHGKTKTSLARTDENLSASLMNITNLEKSLSDAGEKYIFMQKLRDFISVICDFLQHKAPYIEELEEHMQELHKKRASAVVERRAADNDDEMPEIQAAVDAAMAVLDKGGSYAAASSAALAASATIRQQKKLPVKLDELGRDLNLQKRMDMDRRAAARQRRRAQSDSEKLSAAESDVASSRMEGESSTDESDDESEAYKSNRDLLLQTAEGILSDAAQEFSQLSLVKERFERWKRLYSGSYRDAYMSLSIPAIFSPYVRLELLKWDPLHEDVDFYDMRWHSLLFDYGVPADGNDFSPDDADADLVPGLVEKVALPILHHDIAHCWDVLSARETKNAVSATTLIINYVPASSEALKELIAVIRDRLAEAVFNLVVPTWSTLVMKAVPHAARLAAYQFGMAVRLMRNVCMWKDILAMPVLEKLALDELLAGKVLPHVQNLTPEIHDAIARTERIIASLSGVWAGPSVTGARSRKLQPLVDYVKTLGKTLEKKHISEAEISQLARRLKKILVDLNEYDEARTIARTFHLKEAL